MSWRNFTVLFLFISLCLGIGFFHDRIVRKEVADLQDSLLTQLQKQIDQAETNERLTAYFRSDIVYSQWMEPVFEKAQRILWVPWRKQIFSQWERKVHTELEILMSEKQAQMKEDFTHRIANIRNSSDPGLQRLLQILDEINKFSVSENYGDAIKEEIHTFEALLKDKDQKTLDTLKLTGRHLVHRLKNQMKRMDEREVGKFLISGDFMNQIESPVLNEIVRLEDSKIRQKVLDQFKNKILNILNKKKTDLAKNETRRQAEINRVFQEVFQQKTALQQPPSKKLAPSSTSSRPYLSPEVLYNQE